MLNAVNNGLHSTYNYFVPNQNDTKEEVAAKYKRIAIVAGTTALAVAIAARGSLPSLSWPSTNSTDAGCESFTSSAQEAAVQEAAVQGENLITEELVCEEGPMAEGLRQICQINPNSTMGKIFNVVNKTVGISDENFLPWDPSFTRGTGYIDNISPSDMSQAVMVGNDQANNKTFVAVKYTAETAGKSCTDVLTFFPRYGGANRVTSGGGESCLIGVGGVLPGKNGPLEPIYSKTLFSDLEKLLRGEPVTYQNQFDKTDITLTLAK